MKTLYFDCFAGVSGDMTIGALLHLGVDFSRLEAELQKLKLEGYTLSVREVTRAQISSYKFDVEIYGELQKPTPLDTSHHHHHDHSHEHEHDHPHEHTHATHGQGHADEHGHRTVTEIHRIIAGAGLSPWVTSTAQAIFTRLAEAEGKIHGIPADRVHFHEVGAVDAIIDIVGACIGFDLLGVEHFMASPLHVGFGFVNCAHGRYPIPAPGTAELLTGVPTYALDIEGEFVTPTGAAIVTTLCSEFTRSPNLVTEKIGYGAGGRDFPRFPNTLRLMLGESEKAETGKPGDQGTRGPAEVITVIEANIDDMNPQIFGHLMDRLLAEGALDVFYTPIQMKKNRPGTLLTVLCRNEQVESFTAMIFSETTTLGVRYYETYRRTLGRQVVEVETEYGLVKVKTALLDGKTIKAMPEYEDCRRLALAAQVPLSTIQSAALAAFHQLNPTLEESAVRSSSKRQDGNGDKETSH